MTPTTYTRRSARVEAIHLDDWQALKTAQAWLHAHGLTTHITCGYTLIAWDDADALITARLNEWLAHNPETGEFTAWDAEQFQAAHTQTTGAAQ